MGSSKAKTAKPTEAEIASAAVAKDEFDNWMQNYVPREKQQAQQVLDQTQVEGDRTMLRSRASADAAQAGKQYTDQAVNADLQQGRQGTASNEAVGEVTGEKATALGDASTQAVTNQIQRSLNTVRLGRNLAAERTNGLRQQAQLQNETMLNKLNIKMQESATKQANIAKVAGSAITAGYGSRLQDAFQKQAVNSGLRSQVRSDIRNAPDDPGF